MGKTIYMECHSGISGDMTVAALLDLGADQRVLRQVLDSMPLKEFQVEISRVKKSGLDCMDFSVVLDKEYENHDDDMEYLYGHEHHEHEENHGYGEGHEHHRHEESHGHGEGHEHHGHEAGHGHGEGHEHHGHQGSHGHAHHEHRGLHEVLSIIERTEMTDGARKIAERIFRILAAAEAKAHGVSVEEVHFHEVGAVDSIVDIVSAAVCFENLGITDVIVPEVCEGRGTVRCAHGILPVPVPATAAIMEKYPFPVRFLGRRGELVTPTGAAILAAMMTSNDLPGRYQIEKTGLGAGKRSYEQPSILRMMLIRTANGTKRDSFWQEGQETKDLVYKLEADMDDCTGEALGYVMERLFSAGAKDVHYIPVYMKKNRPGIQLTVICEEKDRKKLEQIIFLETTTIGIRRSLYERTVLPRKIEKISTEFGEVQVKVCEIGEEKRYYPEYESVAKICREQEISYQEAYKGILCQLPE